MTPSPPSIPVAAPAADAGSVAGPLVLLDGDCVLCHRVGRFLLRHDRTGTLTLAALSSPLGQRVQAALSARSPLPDSFIFVDANGHSHLESEAAWRVARYLQWPWRWGSGLRWLPRSWRDAAYRWVARRRRRWFGSVENCPLPTPEERRRLRS